MLEKISAVTLAVADMSRSLQFYERLGFVVLYGGPGAAFTSLRVGDGYLNLEMKPAYRGAGWGRAVLYVSDVDALHSRATGVGLTPEAEPRDAEWGERYFHIVDPDGHELSFARPLH